MQNEQIIIPIEKRETLEYLTKLLFELQESLTGIDIGIKWRSDFYVQLVSTDRELNFIQRRIIKDKLKFIKPPITQIFLKKVCLGTRGYTSNSLYISLGSGGEAIRRLLNRVTNETALQPNKNYIPNILLGRTEDDISMQEQYNLYIQIENFNKSRGDISEFFFELENPILTSTN